MARTKAVLGAGARLSDFLAASLLARVVPADVVHAVLDEHGCNSQRIRSFPAVAGVYYCIALSLYPRGRLRRGLRRRLSGAGLGRGRRAASARCQVLHQLAAQPNRFGTIE